MTAIVIVAHDGVGESLYQQAEIILGHRLNLGLVSISEHSDPEIALSELARVIGSMSDPDNVLMLTDLPGASHTA